MFSKCLLLSIITLIVQVDASYRSIRDNYHDELEPEESPVNDNYSIQNEMETLALNLHRFRFPNINFTGCIAATRDLADTEQLFYTVFTFGTVIFKGVVELLENIRTCHTESSDVAQFLLCSIVELENSGPIWENTLSDLHTLLSGFENSSLIADLKNCLDLNGLTCLSC